MKIEILTKNYTVSKKFESVLEKKLQKIEKFFESDAVVKVCAKQVKDDYILELTIFADKIFRAEVRNKEDMYTNIDTALGKIIRQLKKHKTRLIDMKAKDISFDEELAAELESDDDIVGKAESETNTEQEMLATLVRTKKYNLKPMTTEEATLQMELLGHNFFVFLNAESENVSIIYKRNDGNVGIIETVV